MLSLTGLLARADSLATAPSSVINDIQADWLAQAEVRGVPHPAARPAQATEDAAGACDGIRNGKFGFHTGQNDQPSWWQVDLGRAQALHRAVIYNRCDFPTAPAAQPTAAMELQLSDDQKAWRTHYRHAGAPFYGVTDGKPLTIALDGQTTRYLRIQVPPHACLHLDEVEVYGMADSSKNLALRAAANQSSTSQWSISKAAAPTTAVLAYPIAETIERGRRLAGDLGAAGVPVSDCQRELEQVAQAEQRMPPGDAPARRALYLQARAAVRRLALANPLLDFASILFVTRAAASYSHMSDQYYSWWARPGGGLFVLQGFKTDSPRLRCLTAALPEGSILSPDISFDGKKALFSFCRFYPDRARNPNKLDKESQPEDSFYHVFEVNLDGTGLRQITRGRYDDFFARCLPSGEIVFLSTRRGHAFQCGKASAMATLDATQPDSFVRCGGDASRPVSVYTLHVMNDRGADLRAISPFENFEWDPSVADDGRILYARWDYVDRDNMPYMKLWSTNADGTNPQAVYGNYTRNPQCAFEPRSIPGSRKIVFTAAAHHALTGGSLVLLDPAKATEDQTPLTRLTPEVVFPESEGWSLAQYANPWPLSETYYLTAWGFPIQPGCPPQADWGTTPPPNALGIYLYDAFGNLELLHRDPSLCSMYPIPVRPRTRPPVLASEVDWNGRQEGRFLVQDVYAGLEGMPRTAIKRLRIVAMPIKTQPHMNKPNLGVTGDDPGKCVLGTVPVEADGSAYFRVPSGVCVFFQALDDDGRAVQTMRSLTHVQPGQTLSCIGCHEDRKLAPASSRPLAAAREPSRITPGPEGSWPMRFDRLVQPVLDRHCVSCHARDAADPAAARLDLVHDAYEKLVHYGRPSLADHVRQSYSQGRSIAGAGPSQSSALLKTLKDSPGHEALKLDADSRQRLVLWIDLYGQRQGSFSAEQEMQLLRFRGEMADLLE